MLAVLPPGSERVVARRASGEWIEARIEDAGARVEGLDAGTWGLEARAGDGRLIDEDFTTVGAHAGERPVHGFATSFEDDDVAPILDWHAELRSTVVQMYDWMESYTAPLGAVTGWRDPSNRPVSLTALQALNAGLRAQGAVSHAYAPVYAVGNQFADEHLELHPD